MPPKGGSYWLSNDRGCQMVMVQRVTGCQWVMVVKGFLVDKGSWLSKGHGRQRVMVVKGSWSSKGHGR